MGRHRVILRGEVYDVDLGQPVGREPAFRRPALVVSSDVINNGPGDLVVVVPIGTVGYGLRTHVELEAGAGGLDHDSYARCDQLRTISTRRVTGRRGRVGPEHLVQVDRALAFLLDL